MALFFLGGGRYGHDHVDSEGQPSLPPHAFLLLVLQKADINNKVISHKLRRSYAANLFNAGVEQVVIKVLFGHERSATTPIYAHVGQEHME